MPRPVNATRADIIALLKEGHSNSRIVRELHVDKARVRRIREELQLSAFVPVEQTRTLEEKWASLTRPVDGGHLEWIGEHVGASGSPVMRYKDDCHSPTAIAFEVHHGRPPRGYAIADCGLKHCVAPGHVLDEAGRMEARRQLRDSDPASHCAYGHDQSEHGKFESDGTAYCGRCKRLDKQERRDPTAPRRERVRPVPTSFEDVFHTRLEEADGGHVRWTGPVLHRTPAVRFDGRLQSAYRVSFRLHHGREPEGLAMPACDVPLCVAGGCLEDRRMRDAKQLEERQARQREKQLDRLYAGIFGRAA